MSDRTKDPKSLGEFVRAPDETRRAILPRVGERAFAAQEKVMSEAKSSNERGSWLPIELAPRDSTRIELWVPRGAGSPGQATYGRWQAQEHLRKPKPYFAPECHETLGVNWLRSHQPTHWRSAPAGPADETRALTASEKACLELFEYHEGSSMKEADFSILAAYKIGRQISERLATEPAARPALEPRARRDAPLWAGDGPGAPCTPEKAPDLQRMDDKELAPFESGIDGAESGPSPKY